MDDREAAAAARRDPESISVVRRRTVDYVVRGARSHVYAAVVTVLIAVVGVAGSVFTEEIGSAFPFVWPWLDLKRDFPFVDLPVDGFSAAALVFWIFLILTGLVFGVRQWAIDLARKESQARADAAVQRLEHLIRTVPSADFLTQFWDIYCMCDATMQGTFSVDAGADAETLRTAIRKVLRGLALLAWEYDGRPDPTEVTYAANIMVYRPKEEISEDEWPSLRKRMLFDPVLDTEDLRGVLDLRWSDLSTTAFDEEASADTGLSALALPLLERAHVSLPPEYRLRWRILPGAPIAFHLRQASHFVNAADLLTWCEENGMFTREVKMRLAEYFRPDAAPMVGSFISLPLLGTDPEAEPIGVLNIHRSDRGLLKEVESAAEHFVPIVRPLQLMLWKLLAALRKAEIEELRAEVHARS
ncbi:MAG TPA: hypothetical protein VF188_17315 [Longimicrobiales bacterium]